jgi:hypothetical protein
MFPFHLKIYKNNSEFYLLEEVSHQNLKEFIICIAERKFSILTLGVKEKPIFMPENKTLYYDYI